MSSPRVAWRVTIRLLIQDLRELGYINLEVFDFQDTIHHEFFAFLRRPTGQNVHDRMALLKQIEREQYGLSDLSE